MQLQGELDDARRPGAVDHAELRRAENGVWRARQANRPCPLASGLGRIPRSELTRLPSALPRLLGAASHDLFRLFDVATHPPVRGVVSAWYDEMEAIA